MVVFLFRPSPQVPEPSLKAAQLCFEASRFNVYVQRQQIATKSVDLTWIFTQSLFMAINTLLWALSYSGIRKEHPKMDVERHLTTALEAIYWASQKWPGVDAARELYTTLVEACLKAYDGDEEISYSVGSPKANAAASPQSIDTPPPLSTPSTIHSTLASAQTDAQSPPFIYNVEHSEAMPATTAPPTTQSIDFANGVSHPLQATSLDHGAEYANSSGSQEILFDPNSYNNPLPSPLDYGYSPEVSDAFYPSFSHDRNHYFDSIGEQYTQYLQAQYMPQGPMDGLNLEQQSELMNTLELNGLYGLSAEK